MVLVILAILAAILVPALTGWIDEARKKNYVLEARNIYMSTQAVIDEEYAKDNSIDISTLFTTDPNKNAHVTRVQTLSDNNTVTFTSVTPSSGNNHEIGGMVIGFTKNSKSVTATLNGGTALDSSGWAITEN